MHGSNHAGVALFICDVAIAQWNDFISLCSVHLPRGYPISAGITLCNATLNVSFLNLESFAQHGVLWITRWLTFLAVL